MKDARAFLTPADLGLKMDDAEKNTAIKSVLGSGVSRSLIRDDYVEYDK